MAYSTSELRELFEMMGVYNIAILESDGTKIVKAPDTAPTLKLPEAHEVKAGPRSVAEDPMLYNDGVVPGVDW